MKKHKETRYGWIRKDWTLKDNDIQETIESPVISRYPIKDLLVRIKITIEDI